MKKLLCLIAVIALTAPVMAADGDPNVAVTCDDTGLVSYAVLVEDGVDPGLMRGIALDITASNGALITGISGYATGAVPADSTQIPAGYSVFMGSLVFAADPNLVADFGDPVAPNTDPDALGGLATSGITVEMGSLYAEGDPAPATSGDLFKLDIDLNGATETVLTIAANTTRGGCVMENGSPANVVSSGCTIGISECMAPGGPGYADWVTLGKPDCWCYKKQCHGDIDGANFGPFAVAANDFTALKAAISKPVILPGQECADLNHAKFGPFRVAADDFAELKRWISKPLVAVCSGPGCVGFQGSGAAAGPCDTNPLPNSEYNFWTN